MNLTRRVAQLYVGLTAYAISMALLIRSDLGVMPWDVLHQGLSRHVGHSIGFWVIVVGGVVLLAWIPLHVRPGVGTVSNIVVIGVLVDVALDLLPVQHAWAARIACALAGIVVNAVATALYVGARLGPGPRDGLMTGLVRRTGGSIRLVRSVIEVTVVLVGWALGGTLGPATVAYALAVGPLVHVLLPRLTVPSGSSAPASSSVQDAAGAEPGKGRAADTLTA